MGEFFGAIVKIWGCGDCLDLAQAGRCEAVELSEALDCAVVAGKDSVNIESFKVHNPENNNI